MDNEATLKIVNKNEEIDITFKDKYENAKKIYEDSIQEFNDKIAKFTEQKFQIKGGLDTAKYIATFIKEKASWTYVEGKMVAQIYSNVMDEIDLLENHKKDNFELKSMDIEAINYFMQKHTDKGVISAIEFYEHCDNIINAIKPTNDFKLELENDKRNIEIYQFEMNSYMMGVEPSPEVKQNITYKSDFN
jgi:hypothetical protein